MLIRTIRMSSNTYEYKKKDSEEVYGEYCVFGPFDVLDIEGEAVQEWNANWDNQDIRDYTNNITLKYCDGKRSSNNILCVFEEKDYKEEEKFMEQLKNAPYLFLSFLLFDRNESDERKDMRRVLKQINACRGFRAYFSFGKNEIILLHYCNSYKGGTEAVLKKHRLFSLAKASTLFSVRNDALDSAKNMHGRVDSKERIDCRIRGVMRNSQEAGEFIDELYNQIKDNLQSIDKFRYYDVIGGADKLIEIDNYPLEKMLPLYMKNELMTHTNSKYYKAWYNMETELMIVQKGRK